MDLGSTECDKDKEEPIAESGSWMVDGKSEYVGWEVLSGQLLEDASGDSII